MGQFSITGSSIHTEKEGGKLCLSHSCQGLHPWSAGTSCWKVWQGRAACFMAARKQGKGQQQRGRDQEPDGVPQVIPTQTHPEMSFPAPELPSKPVRLTIYCPNVISHNSMPLKNS